MFHVVFGIHFVGSIVGVMGLCLAAVSVDYVVGAVSVLIAVDY